MIDQRLHFHQQRARAFAGDQHHAARRALALTGKKNGGRIGDFLQAFVGHGEHAEFVDRTEAVLKRAQQSETRTAFTFEIQHGIDHVFEHARAGDAALFGDVTDQKYRGPGFLGIAHQPRSAFTHLTDRTRGGTELFAPEGLDGIGNQNFRFGLLAVLQDFLHRGFRQRQQMFGLKPQAKRASGDLTEAFLATDVQCRLARRQTGQGLQQ